MSRTVEEAAVEASHHPDLGAPEAHVTAFVRAYARAYDLTKHLEALRWRTPFQAVPDAWTENPSIPKINPHHLVPGPHT